MTMREEWIWLAEALGANNRFVQPLLDYFGSAGEVYRQANRESLRCIEEINTATVKALCKKDMKAAEQIAAQCDRAGISIVTYEEDRYPSSLRSIFSPPLVLYYRGQLPDFSSLPAFTIVGTRKATKEGEKTAYEFAAHLSSRGICIVSGMAYGIDTQANSGALTGSAPTVAVLGCGVDVVYPPSNLELMDRIIQSGAVISEYPPGTRPLAHHFLARNRIMAGLGMGVLVVEAPRVSGALSTAHAALESGKEVFVVPGSIYSSVCTGSNRLLIEGACPVVSPVDIIDAFQWILVEEEEKAPEEKETVSLSPLEEKLFQLLQYHGKLLIDELAELAEVEQSRVLSTLMIMELKGIVHNLGGDVYQVIG